jgi:carbon monoxide dehydrogenase subunit G
METTFESKVGKVSLPEEKIYNFLSNFNNLKTYIPADKVSNWQSDGDTCSFSVNGMGNVTLRIIEKEPFKLLKITGDGLNKQNFNFWVQLKQVADYDTRVKLTIKADVNPMIKMMVSKPIQKFLDTLIDSFEKMPFA